MNEQKSFTQIRDLRISTGNRERLDQLGLTESQRQRAEAEIILALAAIEEIDAAEANRVTFSYAQTNMLMLCQNKLKPVLEAYRTASPGDTVKDCNEFSNKMNETFPFLKRRKIIQLFNHILQI
jgi:preprotein translocase subunit SecD